MYLKVLSNTVGLLWSCYLSTDCADFMDRYECKTSSYHITFKKGYWIGDPCSLVRYFELNMLDTCVYSVFMTSLRNVFWLMFGSVTPGGFIVRPACQVD